MGRVVFFDRRGLEGRGEEMGSMRTASGKRCGAASDGGCEWLEVRGGLMQRWECGVLRVQVRTWA